MSNEISSIENRPEELYTLPHYKSLPHLDVEIDLEGIIGDFLSYDIFDLDGTQPIEYRHSKANNDVLTVNPSEASLEIYRKEGVRFQLIHVVVNAYGFKEKDGVLHAKPYCISLKASTKRGEVSEVSVDYLKGFDLEQINKTPKHYLGFNPFKNAYGFFTVGSVPSNQKIESDMVGFVYRTYALATKFNTREVLTPGIPSIMDHVQARRDYEKYRETWYFKRFTKDKPRKIWGCDSPIELFLLQAMDREGLCPDVQTIICEDGLTVPSFHKLWENNRSRRRMKMITEADFYFPSKKLAVFCDSKKHHSSEDAIKKDKAIDVKLEAIGITSLRISGVDIVDSPFKCASRVREMLNSIK
ncbi:endonuclease domain-containing protein [Aeromonas dhakensis]|uniref:endonuclease domain-containing protein n=1 Tax=Aeromonas dhakensis TaxID=196024 RepID=UPI001C5A6FDE|nr:endonuclease domain-containing protein [Aeromonas dhakensis]MBW3691704.1 hypothetical protein [Aeromonas dhakensis]